MARELTRTQEIERSINRRFRKSLWAPFVTAVTQYQLIAPEDRIAVCISGGKDSMLMAKLMQELHRHTEVPFELVFLVMDPGYTAANRRKIEENAELLSIPVTFFETNIFTVADHTDSSPCYLCARMRRGALYHKAQETGCNKIALGHHKNDVIETTLMAMFYSGQLQGMMPKLKSRNFPGMELIRPLYRVREEDILAWCRYNDLEFIRCACRLTERAEAGETDVNGAGISKRQEIKALIQELSKTNPDLENNLFRSLHSVWPETFPGYRDERGAHSFSEWYDAQTNMR